MINSYCPLGLPPVFEIGLRHLSHFITGGFFAVLHASVYSILPSLAGGLGFSFKIHRRVQALRMLPVSHNDLIFRRDLLPLCHRSQEFSSRVCVLKRCKSTKRSHFNDIPPATPQKNGNPAFCNLPGTLNRPMFTPSVRPVIGPVAAADGILDIIFDEAFGCGSIPPHQWSEVHVGPKPCRGPCRTKAMPLGCHWT